MDIRRIGVGNSKFPSINESEIITIGPDFTFDSTDVTFDSNTKTFDEQLIVKGIGDYSEVDYSKIDYKTE